MPKKQSSASCQVVVTGKKEPWYSNAILSFFLVLLREAIEPIFLVLGFYFLFTRMESVWTVAHESGSNFILAVNADKEAHPMIYLFMVFVFVAWAGYRTRKVIAEERQHSTLLDELRHIRESLDRMSGIKEKDDD